MYYLCSENDKPTRIMRKGLIFSHGVGTEPGEYEVRQADEGGVADDGL